MQNYKMNVIFSLFCRVVNWKTVKMSFKILENNKTEYNFDAFYWISNGNENYTIV